MRSLPTNVPDRAYHGSMDISPLLAGIPALAMHHLWTRVDWRLHDAWMSGGPHLEEGIPYANIVWEALGLRDRRRNQDGVPLWARNVRMHRELASTCGMIFVTDDARAAERYGRVYEFDIHDPAVLDVVEDPHVRTHSGWIVLMRTGSPVPLTPHDA